MQQWRNNKNLLKKCLEKTISDKQQLEKRLNKSKKLEPIFTWCFLTASWENSDVAKRHIDSRAKYLRFVSRWLKNWPSWLQARTSKFGSLELKKIIFVTIFLNFILWVIGCNSFNFNSYLYLICLPCKRFLWEKARNSKKI